MLNRSNDYSSKKEQDSLKKEKMKKKLGPGFFLDHVPDLHAVTAAAKAAAPIFMDMYAAATSKSNPVNDSHAATYLAASIEGGASFVSEWRKGDEGDPMKIIDTMCKRLGKIS